MHPASMNRNWRLLGELVLASLSLVGLYQLYCAYAHGMIWGGEKNRTHWISQAAEPADFMGMVIYWAFHTLFFAGFLIVFVRMRLKAGD